MVPAFRRPCRPARPSTTAAPEARAVQHHAQVPSFPYIASNPRMRSLRSSEAVLVSVAGILLDYSTRKKAPALAPHSSPNIGNRRLAVTHQECVVHPRSS